MSGSAQIYRNSSIEGSGVYVTNSSFNMDGSAKIYSNSASSNGGGVYLSSPNSRFQMAGGVVYGSNAQTGVRNTAASGNGAALFIATGGRKLRNS